MEYWTLLPAGLFIATIASMMGIGGGIVWVPYLILFAKFSPKEAVMLSFAIQAVGMGSAVIMYIRQKKIFWSLALSILPFIFVGMLSGSFISQRVANPSMIQVTLGIFSMSVAIFFAFQTESYGVALNRDAGVKAPLWLRIASFFMGKISGFLSIGIGDLLIPIVRTKLKIPMQNAVGTALILNFFVALSGGVTHILLSQTKIEGFAHAFAFGGAGVFIGGQIGSLLSSRIDENRLKELFIFLLMIIGLHMIYQSL